MSPIYLDDDVPPQVDWESRHPVLAIIGGLVLLAAVVADLVLLFAALGGSL